MPYRILLLGGLALSLLLVIALLAVENTPQLNTRANLNPDQIAKVKRLLDRNDPRRLRKGSAATAILGQEELDLTLNYAANQFAGGAARLKIESGTARIQATLPLAAGFFGRFINLYIELKQTSALPEISALKLGRLPVPSFIANSLVKLGFSMMPFAADWQPIIRMVNTVRFSSRRMIVSYIWHGNLPIHLGSALLSDREREALLFYQTRLTELTHTGQPSIALTTLLRALFQSAVQRSAQGDAIEENRAVIRVLAFYVNQKNLGQLMPADGHWPKPVWRKVLLQNRDDLSKHYLVSALLAADAGSPLANAVGLYKEIQDSRGGSGFSFNDLAADRAGTLLGEGAIVSEQSARVLQKLLTTAAEADIMPETADLPEFIPEAEFKRRYGGLAGEAYQKMAEEIERRIAALAVNVN